MLRELKLGRQVVSDDNPAYVIAEVGHNHQGNIETAKEMFRQAKACGVNAVKLQKRDNRNLFTQAAFDKPYDHENSFGATYGEHREALEFDHHQYCELQQYAAELDLDFFATAFDHASADLLESLDMSAYKVASADLRNLPLLRHIAAFGKTDDRQHRRRLDGRCRARVRHHHAAQLPSLYHAVHLRIPGRVRGAQPPSHRHLSAAVSGTS